VKRRIQISELEEMRLKAYENASIYKERMKRWYDKRLKKEEFKEGDKVLFYNSRFKTFGKRKLQSKWDGPYVVHSMLSNGAVTRRGMAPLSPTPALSLWWRPCFSGEKSLRSAVCGASF
jgi:hypothetical protein